MFDPVVKVAVCNRRSNSKYKNQEWAWTKLKERNRSPIRTSETAEEYPKLSKEKRDEAKDQGGFVGGWLRGGIRKNGYVTLRGLGALDADHIPSGTDFAAIVRTALSGVEYFIYSTHSHTPEVPRYRIVILLDREVSEDEYPALMRMVARQIGMDYFDDSTYQANRMMYWASCPSNGVFVFEEGIGQPLRADSYLGMYANWRDVSQWPTSTRQSEAVSHTAREQQDPLTKDGLIGAFCRTFFPVTTAIDKFLSDVYEPSAVEGRYDYIPADSNAGVVIYDDKYVYSHHANRRFWIIKCHQEEQQRKWRFTQEERDQIWAEAKHIWESGEQLYLDAALLPAAEEAQREAMEVDERQGLVEEYLDMLLPEKWAEMDTTARRCYFGERYDAIHEKGDQRRREHHLR